MGTFLREVKIETLKRLDEELLKSFCLIFVAGEKPDFEEVKQVTAWMECKSVNLNSESCMLWRRVQSHRPGHSEPETGESVLLAEEFDRYKGSHRLREFLYLWTRDFSCSEHAQSFLQQNMSMLPKQENWIQVRDAFASVRVLADDIEEGGLVSYCAGVASTRPALRQIVLELPTKCSSFELHFKVGGRIIGNAEYRVEHALDPVTGKRKSLFSAQYGACEDLRDVFADLYCQVDPTVEELLSEG